MLRDFKKYINSYQLKYHFAYNFYSIHLIATCISDLLNFNSSYTANIYWFTKIVLVCVLLLYNEKIKYDNKWVKIYFFIVGIYSINIFIDVFIHGMPSFKSVDITETNGLKDFFGFMLAILIALSFKSNPKVYSEQSLNFFYNSLIIGLLLALLTVKENWLLDTNTVRYDANQSINSIFYGQIGCALCITSIYRFFQTQSKQYSTLYLISFGLGVFSIVKAGSRSPLVVLLVVVLFYLFARRGFIKGLLICSIAFVVLSSLSASIMSIFYKLDASIIIRLTRAVNERESSGRDQIYENVLNLIEENPFLGSLYLIKDGIGSGSYPHNFILEMFMANGVIIGLLFIFLIVISLFKSFNVIKKKHPSSWIILLYIQVLVYGMFSSALYSSQDFWALLFFCLTLQYKHRSINRDNNSFISLKKDANWLEAKA